MAKMKNREESDSGLGAILDGIDRGGVEENGGIEADADNKSGHQSPLSRDEIEAKNKAIMGAKFTMELSASEAALITLIRSMKSGNIESLDVSNGQPLSIKKLVNTVNFNDPDTVSVLNSTESGGKLFFR